MKIAVHNIETINLQNDDDFYAMCDLMGVEHLRHREVDVLGRFSHWVTKSEMKKGKRSLITRSYFNLVTKSFVSGVLNCNTREFYVIPTKN